MTGFDENDATKASQFVSEEIERLELMIGKTINPRIIKSFKKSYGRSLGRNIAFGRQMIKIIRKNYATNDTT